VTARLIRARSLYPGSGIAPATMAFARPSAVGLGDQQPIDICEIVRHAERYRGKLVAVSGFYVSGPWQRRPRTWRLGRNLERGRSRPPFVSTAQAFG